MKKRIGSRIYDTETSELICRIDGGQLYRKKTRDREWFAAFDSGQIRPLDPYDPSDMLLMETGHLPADLLENPEPQEYRIRIDQDTYNRIAAASKSRSCSMAEVVRQLSQTL